ncbi:transglycosylase SLT domain-containing protein [Salmonella enterica]|uniref:Lytic transglycosylase domain-containing protein n=2 Tax=Salmonella enterica TaxID=28901 RepID=A0A607T960_SALER|nr:transglycosylase SLT domain-containing protein [Salmonella enterica]EGI6580454.1 transglycosylase SLT domain-containing protein [Salmonella enterica subsp. enterica serovar Typhimurium]EJG4517355.1 transglycosylase SLT domain-containing protein [Escherichia coli]HAB6924562.1 lytic transglycosylase domain-containing protein [Salmonella enterica subsp. enterica serovar Typhi str. CT18]EAN4315913.1 lytic transglycosylase domain-containing protein [Salmonella enterica]EAN9006403.1 lytic transgl
MSGNQMPVLTLDVNEEHLKRLEAIFEKYRNGLMIGPAGTPLKIPSNTGPGGGARQTTTGGEANQAPRKPSSPAPVSAASTDGRLRDEKGRFVGSGKTPDSLVSNYKGRGETMFDKYLSGLGKNAQGTLKTYKQINSTLKTTNSRLKSLFKTTVSWGAKIAAIGVAGPFGYGYMASKVAAQYSVAQGLGMETAQMQAARATYSPYFSGTEELVQHLANAQKNPNDPNYAGLVSLGIDPRDGAAKNLPKLMSALASLVKQYKGSGLTQGILNGQGLGFVDVATTNQVEANLDKIPQLNEKFAANARLLGAYLTPAMQSGYQDTVSNLMVNGNRISNSWYAALARYNPLIRGASDGLTSNIEGFLNGGNFKKILTEAGEGLEKLGKWLNSEQFKNDLDDFSLAVSRIAKAIWSAIKWIGGEDKYLPGTGVGAEQADPVLAAFGNKYLGGALPGANPMTNQYTGEFYKQDDVYKNYRMPNDLKRNIQNFVEQANNTYRLPKNMMSAIAEVESSWNPLARGTPDEKGRFAKGLWQFWDSTAKQYGLVGDDVYDPNKSTLAAGRFLNDLNRRYKGDVAKMLTAYNGGRIDRDGNLSLRMETVKYLIKLLPQIQGALDQHPGIMNQLRNARDNLQGAGKNVRAIIELQVRQSPGSDILAQLAGTQQIPG